MVKGRKDSVNSYGFSLQTGITVYDYILYMEIPAMKQLSESELLPEMADKCGKNGTLLN